MMLLSYSDRRTHPFCCVHRIVFPWPFSSSHLRHMDGKCRSTAGPLFVPPACPPPNTALGNVQGTQIHGERERGMGGHHAAAHALFFPLVPRVVDGLSQPRAWLSTQRGFPPNKGAGRTYSHMFLCSSGHVDANPPPASSPPRCLAPLDPAKWYTHSLSSRMVQHNVEGPPPHGQYFGGKKVPSLPLCDTLDVYELPVKVEQQPTPRAVLFAHAGHPVARPLVRGMDTTTLPQSPRGGRPRACAAAADHGRGMFNPAEEEDDALKFSPDTPLTYPHPPRPPGSSLFQNHACTPLQHLYSCTGYNTTVRG